MIRFEYYSIIIIFAPPHPHPNSHPFRDVAQPGSAPRSGRGGREFESRHPDNRKKTCPRSGGSFLFGTRWKLAFISGANEKSTNDEVIRSFEVESSEITSEASNLAIPIYFTYKSLLIRGFYYLCSYFVHKK